MPFRIKYSSSTLPGQYRRQRNVVVYNVKSENEIEFEEKDLVMVLSVKEAEELHSELKWLFNAV